MSRFRVDRRTWGALCGVLAAAAPALFLWHFTVDDALIPARYADHLARGLGYRFNSGGPSTDGVTALGWAHLLALAGGDGPLPVLRAAKLIGLVSWLGAAAALGVVVTARRWGGLALLLVACSAPLAAWSVAGLETGLAIALGAVAVVSLALGAGRGSALAAGLVAALRPEALPWALVLALAPLPARPPVRASDAAREADALPARVRVALGPRLPRLALALGPFVGVALLRLAFFGRVAPLALLAKPSDFAHGWRYALACALLTGPVAILAVRRIEPWCRWLQLSVLVHLLAVAFAGGDWMPLSRLVVPVLPAVVVAAAHVLDRTALFVALPRLGLALAGLIFVLVRVGPSAARVELDRRAVMAELRSSLAPARVVATLDIGWVGAVSAAELVDLAGVTDPMVAVLPGGHTSKRIPPSLLESRRVDTLVLLLAPNEPLATPWSESWFSRIVEQRVAELPAMASEFVVVQQSRHPRLPYVVLRRRARAE